MEPDYVISGALARGVEDGSSRLASVMGHGLNGGGLMVVAHCGCGMVEGCSRWVGSRGYWSHDGEGWRFGRDQVCGAYGTTMVHHGSWLMLVVLAVGGACNW